MNDSEMSDVMVTMPKLFSIGNSDFESIIINNANYIDKSLFIKEIIDDISQVKLILRPRRFGKTLNMSMLKTFFERSDLNKSFYFKHLKIWQAGEHYRQQQGQYPVLFITLKDIKSSTFEEVYEEFKELVAGIYGTYKDTLFSGILKNDSDAQISYQEIIQKKASVVTIKKALQRLTQYLRKEYGKPTIVLIDEYDTPMQVSYMHGYYSKMVEFMRGFLSPILKDNRDLHQAVLTGVIRVAKESIFSGLNNLRIYTALSEAYSEYFGFTIEEIKVLLDKMATEDLLLKIKNWYGGYQIGPYNLFNPWSVVNFIFDYSRENRFSFKSYWINTSENVFIQSLLNKANTDMQRDFEKLIKNRVISKIIDEHIAFDSINNNSGTLWSFLLLSGYLTVKGFDNNAIQFKSTYELIIPNQEIYNFYLTLVKESYPQETLATFGFKNQEEPLVTGVIFQLARLYQRLAFIRLPVFKKPQPLSHSYVHLMLVDQHSDNSHVKLLTQSPSEESDNISTPWLSRYRSYEDVYRVQKAVAPEYLCQTFSRAIVIGRAGVGKSTFCRYGLYRWALNFHPDPNEAARDLTPWWTQYDLIFWIPLRSLLNYQPHANTQKIGDNDLAALIMHVLASQPEMTEDDLCLVNQDTILEVLKNKQLKILYLLDGLDEAERLLEEETYSTRLLSYLLRKNSYVLTSRPHALEKAMEYQSDMSAYYELMGFANEDIPLYVARAFKLNERSVGEGQQLLKCLETNINMWTAAHTPIQLALLCALWKDDLIPQSKTLTMTNFYTILLEWLLGYNVQQLVYSSSLRDNEKENLLYQFKSRKALIDFIKPLYGYLGKIAFISLLQNKLIINDNFLLEQLNPIDLDTLKKMLLSLGYTDIRFSTPASLLPWLGRLGILHAIPLIGHNEYEFIHLTFQEYLAAYYLTGEFITDSTISLLDQANSDVKISTVMGQLVDRPAWQMVLSFMAGQLYARTKHQKDQPLATYMALLAKIPESFLRQATSSNKRFNCAELLIKFADFMPGYVIQRTLLLAYSLEECEIMDIPDRQIILDAIKTCGTRALLFPRDFPAYRQERISIVHALKLCPRVFAASQLLERLEHPEKQGIHLPETLYLAQAALLQIKQQNTLMELILLLQKAIDSNLERVQLQIIDDILQWTNTYIHCEEVVVALGLCLCSNSNEVVEKASASLEEIKIVDKSIFLTKARTLLLTAKDHNVKIKAALSLLYNDFYHVKAWQSLIDVLNSWNYSSLKEINEEISLIATSSETLIASNNSKFMLPAGRIFAWLLISNVLGDMQITYNIVKTVTGLLQVVQNYLIELISREEETYKKLRIIEIFDRLNHFNTNVIQALILMVADSDCSVRKQSIDLLSKTLSADYLHVNIKNQNASNSNMWESAIKYSEKIDLLTNKHIQAQNLDNLNPIDQEMSPHYKQVNENAIKALIKCLKDIDYSVRESAAQALSQLYKSDEALIQALHVNLSTYTKNKRQKTTAAFEQFEIRDIALGGQAYIKNLGSANAAIRQEAAEALIQLEKVDARVIEVLMDNLSAYDVAIRQEAAEALIQLGKVDARVIEVLTNNLSAYDVAVRQEAATALKKIGKCDMLIMELAYIRNLSSANAAIRQEAVEALIQLEKVDARVIEVLMSNLIASDRNIKHRAAKALILLGKTDGVVIEVLTNDLGAYDVAARQEAAEALIQLEKVDAGVIEVLMNNLSANDGSIRQRAVEALIKLNIAPDTIIRAKVNKLAKVATNASSIFKSNTKVPIRSFGQSNSSTKRDPLHVVDKVKTLLKSHSHMPADFQLGTAIGQGDCFFDAVAQGLNQLTGKQECDVKSLRLFCEAYAKELNHAWVKDAVLKDNDNYEQYLARIAFTVEEMVSAEWNIRKDPAVWGRPHIEGRMICEQYDIQLHVIEVLENEDASIYVMEQLVTKLGSRSIEPMAEEAYTDARILHLVVYRNHFVPILPKATYNVELKSESAQFNECSLIRTSDKPLKNKNLDMSQRAIEALEYTFFKDKISQAQSEGKSQLNTSTSLQLGLDQREIQDYYRLILQQASIQPKVDTYFDDLSLSDPYEDIEEEVSSEEDDYHMDIKP